MKSRLKLNLGSGSIHIPGFLNVDTYPPADLIADLDGDWPFEDESVVAIRTHAALEHLKDRVHAIEEAYRILEPGGILEITVPHFRSVSAHSLFHYNYWSEHTMDPVISTDLSGNEARVWFRPILIHVHHDYPWRWHLNKYLPAGETWDRLPLGHANVVHFVLEKI